MKKMMTILGMVFLLALAVLIEGITVQAVAMPSLPSDVNITPPDASLPKELAAFYGQTGKWYATVNVGNKSEELCIIIERIDEKEVTLYFYNPVVFGWIRPANPKLVKEYGKWKIWFQGRSGINELYMKGDKLILTFPPARTVVFSQLKE